MHPAPTGGSALPAPPEKRRDGDGSGGGDWYGSVEGDLEMLLAARAGEGGAFGDGAASGGGCGDPVEAEPEMRRQEQEDPQRKELGTAGDEEFEEGGGQEDQGRSPNY
jgi:hypothetical protein